MLFCHHQEHFRDQISISEEDDDGEKKRILDAMEERISPNVTYKAEEEQSKEKILSEISGQWQELLRLSPTEME